MEIQSFKKKKNNKYELVFKNGESVELYDETILKYNLLLNKKVEEKKWNEILEENKKLDAYYIALKYLNTKMRTKLEIKKYLEKKEFDFATINKTIEKLSGSKLIDEDTYVKAYLHDQISFSNNGPAKIKNKLYELGIEKQLVNERLQEIDKSIWYEKLEKQIAKKVKRNKTDSIAMLKNKIISSFYKEGYDKNMIISILENMDLKNDSSVIQKEYEKIKKKLEKKYTNEELEFHIKMKLRTKGFSVEEIEQIKTGN